MPTICSGASQTRLLRSLDALHLSLAEALGASGFATSDRNQAEAARALGFRVTTFF
ncbi:MAG: hypothetical protein AB1830_09505 [Pseudomonadota bacterium]